MSQSNTGTANYAAQWGVPGTSIVVKGRSGTNRTLTIFNSFDVSSDADISQTMDNQGEIQAQRARNDRITIQAACKPVAANAAAALVICGDLPKKNSLVVSITPDASETDLATSGSIIVDDSKKAYTPEGEAVITLTLTLHVGKTFTALS